MVKKDNKPLATNHFFDTLRAKIPDRDIHAAFKTLGDGIDNTPEGRFKDIEKPEPEIIGQLALKIAQ